MVGVGVLVGDTGVDVLVGVGDMVGVGVGGTGVAVAVTEGVGLGVLEGVGVGVVKTGTSFARASMTMLLLGLVHSEVSAKTCFLCREFKLLIKLLLSTSASAI